MDVLEMLEHQDDTPLYTNKAVDRLLGNYLCIVPIKTALNMFMLGYIEGKRAERARREKVRYDQVS